VCFDEVSKLFFNELYEKNQRIYLTDPTGGGATPGRARSNDLAGRFTALAPPCLPIALFVVF